MVQSRNIRVTVHRYDDNKPYPEYKLVQNPTKPFQIVNEAYIEAVPGERFAVVVTILPALEFRSSPVARIKMSLDGKDSATSYVWRRKMYDGRRPSDVDSRQRTWGHTLREVDGVRMKCGLVFNEQQFDGKADSRTNQIAHDMNLSGKITVEVCCGTLEFTRATSRDGEQIPQVSFTSKHSGNIIHVPDAANLLDAEKSGHPPPGTRFTATSTLNRTPVELSLLYRPKIAMKELNIVPKIPLAPRPKLLPHSISNAIAAQKQKVLDLPLYFSDDDEEPLPKKIKQELGPDCQVSRADAERDRLEPRMTSVNEAGSKTDVSASITLPARLSQPPLLKQKITEPRPIIIKVESEDEDLVIVDATPVSRVQSISAPAPAQVSAASVQHDDQAKRERKKAILKKRLEQLKIEQELLEMED